MHTIASKYGTIAFLFFAGILCFAQKGFSQNNRHRGDDAPIMTLGSVPVGTGVVISNYDLVLSNPQFVCRDGWEIVNFELAFQPQGKDFYGPFFTRGGKLTDKEIALFRYFRDEGIKNVRVFIENTKVMGPDKQTRSMGAFVFTIQQR